MLLKAPVQHVAGKNFASTSRSCRTTRLEPWERLPLPEIPKSDSPALVALPLLTFTEAVARTVPSCPGPDAVAEAILAPGVEKVQEEEEEEEDKEEDDEEDEDLKKKKKMMMMKKKQKGSGEENKLKKI